MFIVQQHINMLHGKAKNYNGYDLKLSNPRSQKSREINEFELVNKIGSQGFVIGSPELSLEPVTKLMDHLVVSYHESEAAVELTKKLEKEESESEGKEIEIGGKVIFGIKKANNKFQVITNDPNPSNELKAMINQIMECKALADLKIHDQIMAAAAALKVGTLDLLGNKLVEFTGKGKDDHRPVTGKITKKQVIATIWFMTRMYMHSQSFQKNLCIKIELGKYVCEYINGQPFFHTQGLSQTEIDIINDLKLVNLKKMEKTDGEKK